MGKCDGIRVTFVFCGGFSGGKMGVVMQVAIPESGGGIKGGSR